MRSKKISTAVEDVKALLSDFDMTDRLKVLTAVIAENSPKDYWDIFNIDGCVLYTYKDESDEYVNIPLWGYGEDGK